MQLHQLISSHKKKQPKRIGRGGKRGTYSGRGMKGQKSRAGARIRPALRDLVKKIPKLRGYKFKSKISVRGGSAFGGKNQKSINVGILNKKFEEGERITPAALLKKGIVHKIKGKLPGVKLLGGGFLKRKLLVERCKVSKKAKEKIEAVGGTTKQ